MSTRPFMQLYVSDFIGDTLHLSAEEIGSYLLILMAMWNAGGTLPSDDAKLARISRMSVKKWRQIAPNILPFFEVVGAEMTNHRLVEEIQKSDRKSEFRASAGSKGGRAKSLKNKEPDLANAVDGLKHLPDTIKKEKGDSSLRSLSRPVASDTDQREIPPDRREIDGKGTAPKRTPARSPAASTEHEAFPEFLAVFPRRLGTNTSREEASRKFDRAVRSGADPGRIIDGARRYRDQCIATGKLGADGKNRTEFVQQIARWLNNRGWEEAYELPDQPQFRDDRRSPAAPVDPLFAAIGRRMQGQSDRERAAGVAPAPVVGDPLRDPRPNGDDRGEFEFSRFGRDDHVGAGPGFVDAAPARRYPGR